MTARLESRLVRDRRWRCRVALGRVVFVLAALTTLCAVGDAPPRSIEYLTIGVPRARLSELGLKALPVNRKEFEKRIDALNDRHRAMTDPVGTRVISAVYQARLAGDHLVDGLAALRIKHALPQAGYVPLEPLGMAVQRFQVR